MQIKNKPRIAIIGVKGFPAFGGAARSMEEIIKRISKSYEITTFEIDTHADENYKMPDIKRNILKSQKLKRINTFSYYIKAMLSCLKGDFDLVITNHMYCGFIIPFLKLKFKVINVVHGIIPKDDIKWNKIDKMFFKVFEKLSVRFSDISITVSEPHLAYLKKIGSKNSIFIPNGIDREIQKNITKEVKEYLLFAAARIIKLKGCHTFLEAMQWGLKNVEIKIIGDIDQVFSYKNELLKLSNGLKAEFIGLIKEKEVLFKYIADTKYFIFPSYNEGMSNMLLEVAALKTPIICSDIVENKAVFNDGEVLFFKVGDSADLSEKINWAINHGDAMLIKADNAYKTLQDKYDWNLISFKYCEIINSFLKG